MKKLIIKEPIPNENQQSGFYLSMTFMHGDADGYTTKKFGPFQNNEQDALLKLIEIIEKQQESELENSPEDTFDLVPGLYQWFDADCFDSEEEFASNYGEEIYSKEVAAIENINEIIEKTGLCWVNNPDGYGDKASLEAFWITYINESKIECEVEIEN